MDGNQLWDCSRKRALELPASTVNFPFGAEYEVFKVKGKMFMFLYAHAGEQIIVLKATPEDVNLLCQGYEDISPGYHMNKKHWITVHPHGALTQEEVEDLITESYLLVVEKLPKAQRPVNTETFGQET